MDVEIREKLTADPPVEIPMQYARTCATCFIVTDYEVCPKCKNATTRVFVPQEVLMDQLVRHVIKHVAGLGAKIEALTDEIRVKNKLEADKKRFSQLKNKVLADLSKNVDEEGSDVAEP